MYLNLAICWLKTALYPSALELVSTAFLACSNVDQSILHKQQYSTTLHSTQRCIKTNIVYHCLSREDNWRKRKCSRQDIPSSIPLSPKKRPKRRNCLLHINTFETFLNGIFMQRPEMKAEPWKGFSKSNLLKVTAHYRNFKKSLNLSFGPYSFLEVLKFMTSL